MKVTTVRLMEEESREVSDLAKLLRREKSEVLREAVAIGLAEMRLKLAIEAYSKGKISIGRAAELAKIGLFDFHVQLKKRGVTVRYGEERLDEELKNLGLL